MVKAKKSLGQNFLNDPSVISHIVKSVGPKAEDRLVEIGPGQGALTEHLAGSCQRLDLIELDDRLIPQLQKKFVNNTTRLHHQDVLTMDWDQLYQAQTPSSPLRLVGNLPYQISSPLLFQLLEHRQFFKDMLFMLQKEVVDRIAAPCNSKNYGRLSVMLQTYFDVEKGIEIEPESFSPAPKVHSALIQLWSNERELDPKVFQALQDITQKAFQQRRKTVRNSLKEWQDHFTRCDIDPSVRAQNLTIEQYYQLACSST